jgi:hypothetical protein
MNIKFGKKDIIEMVEKYYKEELDITGKVSITCSKQLVGYGMGEHEVKSITGKSFTITAREKKQTLGR